MPKPYVYVKLSQFGTMYGNQTWSIGLSVQPLQTAPPTPSQLTTWLAALEPALRAWWTPAPSIGPFNAAGVLYQGARAYSYAANATTAFGQAELKFSTALQGNSANTALPLQTSLVSSVLSGSPGRSNRGRRYIPWTSSSLVLSQVATADVDKAVGAEVTLMNVINGTALGVGVGTCVIANDKDFPSLIRSVRVDSECDIQRRRADKIAATYFKTTALA